MKFVVTGGAFEEYASYTVPPVVQAEHVLAYLKMTQSNAHDCPPGTTGVLTLTESQLNTVDLHVDEGTCRFHLKQSAAPGPNSVIQLLIQQSCLTPGAPAPWNLWAVYPAQAQPLCGSLTDLEAATAEGGTAGTYFTGSDQGKTTCTGAVGPDPQGPQFCDTFRNADGGTETATATVNGPLPSGDSLWLVYDGGYGSTDPNYKQCDPTITGPCVLAKTSTAESVSATVTVPTNVAGPPDYIRTIAWYPEVVNSAGQVQGPLPNDLYVILCSPDDPNTNYVGHPHCG